LYLRFQKPSSIHDNVPLGRRMHMFMIHFGLLAEYGIKTTHQLQPWKKGEGESTKSISSTAEYEWSCQKEYHHITRHSITMNLNPILKKTK